MIIYLVIGLVVVVGLGIGLLWLVSGKRQVISETEQTRVREMWNNVDLLMADEREASWVKAVFEADKILDYVLNLKNVAGANLGEKLKNGKSLFGNVQVAWDAHKLRNQLAHEVDVKLARHEAERAIRFFKDSIGQLGIR
jgi:hypothetical protein